MALSVEVWPRRKYEISRDANPFPTGRPLPEAYGKLARAVETSRECQISKRSLQISVQINYYPHGRRASSSSSPSLSHSLTRLCLRFLFLLESLVASFPPPLLSTFYEASLRIQTRQPSTSTTIHRRRLRRLTLLEMQRLRRMFENVFSPSPSFLLSLSLFHFSPGIYVYRSPRSQGRQPRVTDGNLATDLLPEMLTKCSRVPACRER